MSRFKHNTNESSAKRDTVKFSIFYDSLSIVEVTEYPAVSIIDLVSNIGTICLNFTSHFMELFLKLIF